VHARPKGQGFASVLQCNHRMGNYSRRMLCLAFCHRGKGSKYLHCFYWFVYVSFVHVMWEDINEHEDSSWDWPVEVCPLSSTNSVCVSSTADCHLLKS
jgi:hypothetical protein